MLDDVSTKKSLSQSAYDLIEEAITSGHLDFGEPLSEHALSLALKVSKAPIRSALLKLQEKSLVDIVPQSGCYVSIPNQDQMNQLIEVRVLLETNGLKMAMKASPQQLITDLSHTWDHVKEAFANQDWQQCRINDTLFHRAIMVNSNNQYMVHNFDHIVPLMSAIMSRFIAQIKTENPSFEDHSILIEFLKKGQITEAVNFLRKHIRKNKNFYKNNNWPTARAIRKDYADRDYNKIFDALRTKTS